MPYLKYISDDDLITVVSKVISVIEKADHEADANMHKNVIDPFSALFHSITMGAFVQRMDEPGKSQANTKNNAKCCW
jgi:hypothetical protein